MAKVVHSVFSHIGNEVNTGMQRGREMGKYSVKILFLLWGKGVEEQAMVNPCVSGCHMFISGMCLCALEHFWEVSGNSGHDRGSVEEVRGWAVMSGH